MRLLLDENLSESIAQGIKSAFPETAHVRRVLGAGASDRLVWSRAASERESLVTLDEDFQALSLTLGSPPKVILIDAHNPTTARIIQLLLERSAAIHAFGESTESTILVLRIPRM